MSKDYLKEAIEPAYPALWVLIEKEFRQGFKNYLHSQPDSFWVNYLGEDGMASKNLIRINSLLADYVSNLLNIKRIANPNRLGYVTESFAMNFSNGFVTWLNSKSGFSTAEIRDISHDNLNKLSSSFSNNSSSQLYSWVCADIFTPTQQYYDSYIVDEVNYSRMVKEILADALNRGVYTWNAIRAKKLKEKFSSDELNKLKQEKLAKARAEKQKSYDIHSQFFNESAKAIMQELLVLHSLQSANGYMNRKTLHLLKTHLRKIEYRTKELSKINMK